MQLVSVRVSENIKHSSHLSTLLKYNILLLSALFKSLIKCTSCSHARGDLPHDLI